MCVWLVSLSRHECVCLCCLCVCVCVVVYVSLCLFLISSCPLTGGLGNALSKLGILDQGIALLKEVIEMHKAKGEL